MSRELLLLCLRDAIATKERCIANANMESGHRDGWSCDWNAAIREVDEEIAGLVERIKETDRE